VSDVTLDFSAHCPHIVGEGYGCMVCAAGAAGHVRVSGGPHHGRCLALLCGHHASPSGYADVKNKLVQWMVAGLLATDLGPGRRGAPQVLHQGHLDPLPDHRHDGG
jgi:hypothetical protein